LIILPWRRFKNDNYHQITKVHGQKNHDRKQEKNIVTKRKEKDHDHNHSQQQKALEEVDDHDITTSISFQQHGMITT